MSPTSLGTDQPEALRVSKTRCEYQENPLGIDVESPRLRWNIIGRDRASTPSAYHVIIANSSAALDELGPLLWDSGRVDTQDPTHATYNGPLLTSGQRYYWKVRVWDDHGRVSPWSEPAWWEMALLDLESWEASWLDDGKPLPERDEDFYHDDPAPLFRKTFDIDCPISRARLYIAGLGYYEAYVNGHPAGESVLDPAWTTYTERVLYSTYDVTEHLSEGKNCLGVTLGNGWFNVLPMRMWGQLNLRDYMPVGRPCFVAQLIIDCADGRRVVIKTDDSWRTTEGPILRNDVYLGEVYDAGREVAGWNEPDIDDSNWDKAHIAEVALGNLRAQAQPPIKPSKVFQPATITEPEPGVYIFDFGQNLAGWVRLKVRGDSGTAVKLRYGELLYPDGTLNVMTTVCGQIKQPGMGGPGAPPVAEQSDTYILKGTDGNEEEVFSPRFTYHGFRYVEVTGYPGEPGLDSLEAVRLSTDVDEAGSFSCSNDLLNRIQKMCRETFPSNLLGVQTDCPGRERFGYGDDIACACEAHLMNYDMASFYAKTVRDFADAARPSGALTLLAPWTGHAIGGFDPGGGSFADLSRNGDDAGSGPLSGVLAHSLLLEKAYQFYGNRELLEEQYEVARRSLEFIRSHTDDHIVSVGLGDWSGVVPTDTAILDTALYYQHATIIAKLARILNRDEDAARYEELANQIKQGFTSRFLDQSPNDVGFNTQAARACALYHGLVPHDQLATVAEALIDDVVRKHNGHLSTGIFGTKYLLNALTAAKRPDVAYGVVNQTTYPGWGYMLDRGATTMWEVWDFSDDVYSHNHSMFGTVSAWFFTALGGIQPAPDAVGFDKIDLRPQPVLGLTWVKCSYQSIRGEILSNWRIEGNQFCWDIVIPPTASATINIPAAFADNVREGSGPADEAAGVKAIGSHDGSPVYHLHSGSYSFHCDRSRSSTEPEATTNRHSD